ncbi:hypothetical protein Dimus_007487 [Dionaea muscipula]
MLRTWLSSTSLPELGANGHARPLGELIPLRLSSAVVESHLEAELGIEPYLHCGLSSAWVYHGIEHGVDEKSKGLASAPYWSCCCARPFMFSMWLSLALLYTRPSWLLSPAWRAPCLMMIEAQRAFLAWPRVVLSLYAVVIMLGSLPMLGLFICSAPSYSRPHRARPSCMEKVSYIA